MYNIAQKLTEWRDRTAKNEGVELYRVLSNETIDIIANIKPKTEEDLILIKGIKEKKLLKYGKDILNIVNGNSLDNPIQEPDVGEKIYTVDSYLNLLNNKLRYINVKIIGEVSSIDIRGSYLFFSLKDETNLSMIKCFMWKRNYDLYNIDVVEGMKIIINGHPELYKPSGMLNFMTVSVELVGEGAIKKAYEKLKNKLAEEGLFEVERKKKIPIFPKKIGLITSESGAVIHDFLNNIGKHGYKIIFLNSRVEGQIAVQSLISAIDYFANKDIDVLVIIRGGGSLESLQAFNNEKLVRKIANFNKPVICGIGHDKDVPLSSMVADISVSTPTAVANALNESFDKALGYVAISERDIFYSYQKMISDTKNTIESYSKILSAKFNSIIKIFQNLIYRLERSVLRIDYSIENIKKSILDYWKSVIYNFEKSLKETNDMLSNAQIQLKNYDPMRQLKLGYSIVLFKGKVIKKTSQVNNKDVIDIKMSDGTIKSRVENIINKD